MEEISKFKSLKTGKVGLIQETEDGRIIQIGLTEMQSNILQNFLAQLSQDSPLVQMGEEYELIFKKNQAI